MKSLLPFALLAFVVGVACSTATTDHGEICTLPQGEECCNGDELATYGCDGEGNIVCGAGTRLTPSEQCTSPSPRDAGSDAPTCALPDGMDCCDGDVEGWFTCDADGGVVCSEGTRLVLTFECTQPIPIDAGHDANP